VFMAARTEAPDVLADPAAYFRMLRAWPAPPAIDDGTGLSFNGLNNQDRQAFRAWFAFEHVQRQLLFDRTLPCPLAAAQHGCPGDPLTAAGWQKSDKCTFSQVVHGMGFPGVVVKPA